jgi:hypothetical protein
MFVMSWALGFLIHGGLVSADYARLPNLMRPMADAQSKLPFILLSHISFALAFTWIYLKGREDKPWLAQGARYGIAAALLVTTTSLHVNSNSRGMQRTWLLPMRKSFMCRTTATLFNTAWVASYDLVSVGTPNTLVAGRHSSTRSSRGVVLDEERADDLPWCALKSPSRSRRRRSGCAPG